MTIYFLERRMYFLEAAWRAFCDVVWVGGQADSRVCKIMGSRGGGHKREGLAQHFEEKKAHT
jgi:hypothetical protein